MGDEGWRAQDDLRTLSRAAEIGKDKARVRAAKTEAKKQMSALQTVVGKPKAGARRKRLENVQL